MELHESKSFSFCFKQMKDKLKNEKSTLETQGQRISYMFLAPRMEDGSPRTCFYIMRRIPFGQTSCSFSTEAACSHEWKLQYLWHRGPRRSVRVCGGSVWWTGGSSAWTGSVRWSHEAWPRPGPTWVCWEAAAPYAVEKEAQSSLDIDDYYCIHVSLY